VECFEKVLELGSEDFLGATLQLASLGKRKIPDKTPEKYMQEFYRKKSKRWSDFDKKQDKYRGHLLIKNAFKKTHNPSKQVEILDLGCGTGSLARTLRPYARTLVGVDLSPDMLFKAEEIGLYDSLYKKDLNQYLGEILNHYDTVVAAAVLIHFFNLDKIFFLVRDSLKVNGRFIFSIFEETQKNRDLNSFLMYSHSDDYITALADRLNFKIIYRQKDTHEYHRGIPVPAIIYVLEKLS
jgi:predicted TPR repeat methyltransferase